MNLNIISFIFGVIVNIVDDINDYHIYKEWQFSFELILLLLSVYILFLNKRLSSIASIIFFVGGVCGFIFAPHIIAAPIWKKIIALSVLPFLYTLKNVWEQREKINIRDWKNAVFIIVPLFIFSTLFSLIEDTFVPEEVSKTKIVDRLFQCVMVAGCIYYLPRLQNKYHLSLFQYRGLNVAAWGWLGYALASVIGIIYFFQFPSIEDTDLLN